MQISDVFLKPDAEYVRDMNPLKAYHDQVSAFISASFDIPLDEARKRVAGIIKKKIKEPVVKHFTRTENGDRIIELTPLLTYIGNNVKSGGILAPTLTTYLHPDVKPSILAEFIQENVKIRGKSKKQAQNAKAAGDMELFNSKWNEQNNMKIYNNSLSGTFAQQGSILCNPTGHSTLTSITRSVTSLANSNNEKSLGGNRHYPTQTDMFNNIVYIATKADLNMIEQTMAEYTLYQPTVEDVVGVLRRSSDLYWLDSKFYVKHIIPYLQKLNKPQLAALCYSSDLYHIRTFNNAFMRKFLEELATKRCSSSDDPSVVDKLKAMDENVLNFVHQIWFSEVRGFGVNYQQMFEAGIAANIYYTAINVQLVISKYKSFIKCFLVSDVMPSISNKIRSMLRRVVVISDTDSTCFALDNWVIWYNGFFAISDRTIAIAGAASFLTTQSIPHMLATLSANINVPKASLHTLAMKNEFLWTVHMPTEVGKHYAALTVQQEGKVHKVPEMEIKGVHLKNSATPKYLIDNASALMTKILTDINNNKKLNLGEIISHVIKIEEEIRHSIMVLNEATYFRKGKINDKTSYKEDETKSPYQRHDMWMTVFAPKYGEVGSPPYAVIKIPTIIDKPAKLAKWVTSLDEDIGKPLSQWLVAHNKQSLPTVYVNEEYVKGKGIPKEIMAVLDIKRVLLDLTLPFRLIVESMGVMLDKERLVQEHYPTLM